MPLCDIRFPPLSPPAPGDPPGETRFGGGCDDPRRGDGRNCATMDEVAQAVMRVYLFLPFSLFSIFHIGSLRHGLASPRTTSEASLCLPPPSCSDLFPSFVALPLCFRLLLCFSLWLLLFPLSFLQPRFFVLLSLPFVPLVLCTPPLLGAFLLRSSARSPSIFREGLWPSTFPLSFSVAFREGLRPSRVSTF